MGKHKMPLRCKIRRFFVNPSPSMAIHCKAGLKHRISKCENCECKVITYSEVIDAFLKCREQGTLIMKELSKSLEEVIHGTHNR